MSNVGMQLHQRMGDLCTSGLGVGATANTATSRGCRLRLVPAVAVDVSFPVPTFDETGLPTGTELDT